MRDAISQFDLPLPGSQPQPVSLACRAAGRPDAARRVLLLHGFPQAAFAWDEVLLALAPEAYALAPNQRGYAGSSAPAEVAAYRVRHLVADALALLAHLGVSAERPLDLLVAHDWGGGVAWNLAALRPELIRRLVILNSPHPATFRRELLASPAQRAASAYMHDLVQPDAAARLAADGFAALLAMLERFGDAHWLTPALRAQHRAVWSQGLDGALNWYRASPLRPPTGPHDQALAQLQLPDSVVRVSVPTTLLWGEADHALLPGLLDGLQQWVPELTVHRHPQASHWIVHEQPAWVIAHLKALLA
ncbi:alpha/beta fold hydrolase [Aquabacterium sp. OR-4]|uniref:alpha/beta fold hydrolase n=1 Tax=Aquabacterium sp. OR-4 TaxID=2978127 RepID=UPI0021B417B3|nr:alpha/beta hydrolase [Aquabacterium sp. OR-4]MDT7837347.1 alpha/beta hydrolase [Aquabacterium sp. OR-4]